MEENSKSNSNNNSKKNYYYGKSSKKNDGVELVIKKGPWKAEEDQILINHVSKYGTRDWSSIKSKGLLLRSGKSCRLRWVNKLRPGLKTGCKFTAEEERTVIELQSQIGNKWATIATHLTGRTDNDVKNFWSSRQKRLARIFQSQSPQPLKKQKTTSTACIASKIPSQFIESSSSSQNAANTNGPSLEVKATVKLETSLPLNETLTSNNELQLDEVPFPCIPPLQTYLPLPSETQELIDRLDTAFLQTFGYPDNEPCCGGEIWDDLPGEKRVIIDNPVPPDSFFDDFPSDMFDQIEPLPSPSSW